MNREKLEKCQNMEEVIGEIFRQSVIVNESVSVNDLKGSRVKKEGLYLRLNNKKENTKFDTLLYGLSYGYCQEIEACIEGNHSEFYNDSIFDSLTMIYEVLLNWINGKYWNIITPSSVEEMVDIIFSPQSKDVCNYLFGIVKRLAKNLLAISKLSNNNNYTVNPRKYSWHTTNPRTGKQIWTFCYVQHSSIDSTYYDENDNLNGLYTKNNILDQFAYENRMLEEYEDSNEGLLSAVCQLYAKDKLEKFNEILDGNMTEKQIDSFKSHTNTQMRKAIKKNKSFYNLKFVDNKISYSGDFIDWGRRLMEEQDLMNKFKMIKKKINSGNYVSRIILDLILDLDFEVYHSFMQHLKDDRFVKYYVRSDNFRLILDVILNEYNSQQQIFREIYVYNESQRREKMERLRKQMLEILEKKKDGGITVTSLNTVYRNYIEEFKLSDCYSNTILNKSENKEIFIRALGFDYKRERNKYYLQEIA